MRGSIYFLVLIICIASACREVSKESSPLKARVRVVDVKHEKLRFPVHSSGLVVSDKEIKLSFKTGGIIETIYPEEGAMVKKNQLMAELNMSEIEAQVTQATNGYDKALRDYNRAKNLFTDSVATLEQLQNSESALNVAKANLEIAGFNRSHSKIYAPENGIVLKRVVQASEIIAPGYPVFIFGTRVKYWKIKTGIADKDYVRILTGDSANVTLDPYPGVVFHATVSRLGEAANPLTGTYEVELDLQTANYHLASGFVANVEILPAKADKYYRIPVEALVEAEADRGYVFTVTDSLKAKKVKVKIAGIVGGSIAVSEGLENITNLVTDGVAFLKEGESVTIVK